MSKRNKGSYHYAIQTLESRLAKIKKNPSKFKDAARRSRDIADALGVLRTNSLPVRIDNGYDPKAPLVPIYDPATTLTEPAIAKATILDNFDNGED